MRVPRLRIGQRNRPDYETVNQSSVSDKSDTSKERRRFATFCLGRHQHKWTPLALSNIYLCALSLFFITSTASLLILRHLDQVWTGFQANTSDHYAWTYAPTAILTIIFVAWRQSAYHCSTLTPWVELRTGPHDAEKTILLDYLSPFLPVGLWQAAKNRHWVVTATFVGSIILKLTTVASTGLLVQTQAKVGPLNVDLYLTSNLDGSHYSVNSTTASGLGLSVMYNAYAVAEKGYPLADGTTQEVSYETFGYPQMTSYPNATLSANVHVFVPRLECEVIEPTIQNVESQKDDGGSFYLLVNTPWCPLGRAYDELEAPLASSYYSPPRKLLSVTSPVVNCTGPNSTSSGLAQPFVIALSDARYNQTFNQSMNGLPYGTYIKPVNYTFSINSTTAILCNTSYSIETANVIYDLSGSAPRVNVSGYFPTNGTTLSGFTDSDLSYEFNNSLLAAQSMFGGAYVIRSSDEQPVNTLLQMMTYHVGGNYYTLLDPAAMQKAFKETYSNIAIQIAQRTIYQRTNTTMNGVLKYEVQRLRVNPIPLWMMVSGFMLMLVCTTVIWTWGPLHTTLGDPNPTSSIAYIYSQSFTLRKIVDACARDTEVNAARQLSTHQYSSSSANNVQEIVATKRAGDSEINGPTKSEPRWWMPITLSRWFLVPIAIIALLFIVALQIVQHFSDQRNGLVPLEGYSTFATNTCTRYIPALLVTLLALSFDAFDFNAKVLAPFAALRRNSRTSVTLNHVLLEDVPLVALFRALRMGYWVASLTGFAAFIGSVLTIIISALYTVEYPTSALATILEITEAWNTSWPNSTENDNGASIISSLIETGNLSYPPFTYGELAFPRLRTSRLFNSTWSNSSGSLTVAVPALRPELICVNLTDDDSYSFSTWRNSDHNLTYANVSVLLPLPANCQRGSEYGNESTIDYSRPLNFDSDDVGYFAHYVDIHMGPYGAGGYPWNEITSTGMPQADNPPGCPSVVLHYGSVNYVDPRRSMSSIMMCYQAIMSITTNITLLLPNLTISTEHQPVPDENTAQFLVSGPNNETAFWWRLESSLFEQFLMFDLSANSPLTATIVGGTSKSLDNFWLGVLGGRTPISKENFFDSSNQQAAFNHTQMFYRRYMAQSISNNMRTDLPDIDNGRNQLQAQFTPTIGAPRLVQHRAPALTLQIMLAVMLIAGIVAWTIGDFHGVVRWNPCTIAGVAVLFAGSKMIESEPFSKTSQTEQRLRIQAPAINDNDTLEEETQNGQNDHTIGETADISLLRSHAERHNADIRNRRKPLTRNSTARARQVWWSNAKFRLGYWNDDGSFSTPTPSTPRSKRRLFQRQVQEKDENTRERRYGIDLLD